MSDPFLDDIIKRVRDWDASRPRSLQPEVGWSEVGGCRAYLGYRLEAAWQTDDPDLWPAIRGTAIHKMLETVLAGQPGFRTEVTTSYRGIPGHADLVHVDETSVTDWRTTTLAMSQVWQSDPAARHQKRVQASGYAAGLIDAGELPEDAIVRVVVIPVDGTFEDWWCWSEPFDRSLADWGADRLDEAGLALIAGEPLPKDKPYAWCQSYCRFFSLCRSQDDPKADEEITDPEMVAAIARYGELTAQAGEIKKQKEALAEQIRGLHGTAGDWRISLTKAGQPKTVLDEAAIYADYAERGQLPPETTEDGAAPKLNVRRLKEAS